jgi:hypothetical protein
MMRDEPDGAEPRRPVELVLYVSPASPASARAQRNIQELMNRLDRSKVELDICDVSENIERAEADRILFTPTLVVRRPMLTWIVGDLTQGEEVLKFLRSMETEEEP